MYTISNDRYAEVLKLVVALVAESNLHSTFIKGQPRYVVTSNLVTNHGLVTVVIDVVDVKYSRKWHQIIGDYPVIGIGDSPDLDIIRTWEVVDQLAASITLALGFE